MKTVVDSADIEVAERAVRKLLDACCNYTDEALECLCSIPRNSKISDILACIVGIIKTGKKQCREAVLTSDKLKCVHTATNEIMKLCAHYSQSDGVPHAILRRRFDKPQGAAMLDVVSEILCYARQFPTGLMSLALGGESIYVYFKVGVPDAKANWIVSDPPEVLFPETHHIPGLHGNDVEPE